MEWTGTEGQSLFCTTAVDESTNVAEGEYSIRTSEGVRNSKRALSARIVGALGLAQDATSIGANPISSHFATPGAGMK